MTARLPGRTPLVYHLDCHKKLSAAREGSRELLPAPADRAPIPWLVEGFLPNTLRPTYLVGPFGSMKSYLSLAMGLSLTAGHVAVLRLVPARMARVLYLDFETDEPTFQRRLGNLARGLRLPEGESVPGLFYMRATGTLASMLHEVRAEVAKNGVRLLIVDSAALAAGVDVDFAEAAVRLNDTLGRIGVPALVIAQQSWESIEGGKDTRPYGSVLHSYAAGMIWGIRRQDGLLIVTQGKASDEAGGRRFALRDEWTEDPLSLRFRSAETPAPPPSGAMLDERIVADLAAHGPSTARQVAERVEAYEKTVQWRLSQVLEGGDRVKVVASGGGRGHPTVWGVDKPGTNL